MEPFTYKISGRIFRRNKNSCPEAVPQTRIASHAITRARNDKRIKFAENTRNSDRSDLHLRAGMINKVLFIILISLSLSSCDDFFVRDISTQQVTLTSPSDSTVTTLYGQEFTWEELRGADQYQLQIAYPSFSSVQFFVLDTLLAETSCSYTLTPGNYQWRVRAINSSYESMYATPYTITVDTTSDLTFQQVVLLSPSASAWLSDTTPSFSWQLMSIANEYNIIIKTGSNWTTGTTVISDTVTAGNYTVPVAQYLAEGNYVWGIRAINAISYTQSYTTRTVGVDITNPPTVSLVAPSNNSLQSTGQVNFSWTQPADAGTSPSPRTDSVYLFSDTTATTLIYRDGFSAPSFNRTLTNTGMYSWYIITYDAAGNASDTTSKFKFTLQ